MTLTEMAANTIKLCRIQLGWTQEKLADKTGLKRENISRIESGRQNISMNMFAKLTLVMGFAPSIGVERVGLEEEE